MTIQQVMLTRGVLASTFAQWNPADKSPNIMLAQNDLRAICTDSGFQGPAVRANKGKSAGKWYWEVKCINSPSFTTEIGVNATSEGLTSGVGSTANGYSYTSGGDLHNNGSAIAYPGNAYAINDVISVLLDMDGKTLTFWLNGVSQTQAFAGLTGTLFPAVAPAVSGILLANFGATAFTYTPPAGYAGVS